VSSWLGFQDLGFRVFKIQDLGFKVSSWLGFQDLGFRV
jgi:hypothetical protein